MSNEERIGDLEDLWSDDKDPLIGFLLGAEYLRAARPTDAADTLRKVVALDPAYSAAWSSLALAEEAMGHIDEARGLWAEAEACAERQGDNMVARAAAASLRRLGPGTLAR